MTIHAGGCHCGAIRVEFDSEKPLAPRACQCSFCRKHNARSVSDPDGKVTIVAGDVRRYRFGQKLADFLVCPACGIYVGAVADLDGGTCAVLNLNAFDDPHLDLEGAPFSYDGESAGTRNARRRERWTPARIVEP